MVREVKDLDSFRAILVEEAGNNLVVVDFTPTSCGPCKQSTPGLIKWSEENMNVVFLKVDADVAADVLAECKIQCMPTFQFYGNGKMVKEFSGANYDKLVEEVTSFLRYLDRCGFL